VLLLCWPVLLGFALAIWLGDRHSPLYRAKRVGCGGHVFVMLKLRSMRINADRTGVSSTAGDDPRITAVGRLVRRCKLDELTQMWNVLKGDMSVVGPRPQVAADAALYTIEERRMLNLRPGITDLASIVFADEGTILHGSSDPDKRYNDLIRPWKSRLALLYVDHRTLPADLRIVGLTALALISRPRALARVQAMLRAWGADELLCRMAARQEPLLAYPPPGAEEAARTTGGAA